MSVTLRLADRDAKLVAEGLFNLAHLVAEVDIPSVKRLRSKFVGIRIETEFLRLSAAFETAYEANVR